MIGHLKKYICILYDTEYVCFIIHNIYKYVYDMGGRMADELRVRTVPAVQSP